MKINAYGLAAVKAAYDLERGKPLEAWTRATQKLFPDSPTSQQKGCPKGAFLGLCEEGLVQAVPSGKYTTSKNNKAYALRAVQLLREGSRPNSPKELWTEVMDGQKKSYNSQCDVVLALWNAKLIANETSSSLLMTGTTARFPPSEETCSPL